MAKRAEVLEFAEAPFDPVAMPVAAGIVREDELLKRGVRVGIVALMACVCMADAKTNSALPDMTATLREHRVQRASIAVIRDGRIVSTGAWGMAGPNLAATVFTPYTIASLMKLLTAEVILRLVSAGKLSLGIPNFAE